MTDNQQPTDQPIEYAPPPQPQSIMDNLKFWQLSTLALGLTLIIIIGVYFYTKPDQPTSRPARQQFSPSPTITPFPTITTTPFPTITTSFLNSPTPSVELQKINILPTTGWKTVSQKGAFFKIPPQATCKVSATTGEIDENDCRLIYFDPSDVIPSQINVYEYQGGSRREQFFARGLDYRIECRALFKETMFGSVKALQVAIDGGWCQGGGGGIVAVIGSKLVVFEHLSYHSDTKEIYRFPKLDTVISTLSAK